MESSEMGDWKGAGEDVGVDQEQDPIPESDRGNTSAALHAESIEPSADEGKAPFADSREDRRDPQTSPAAAAVPASAAVRSKATSAEEAAMLEVIQSGAAGWENPNASGDHDDLDAAAKELLQDLNGAHDEDDGASTLCCLGMAHSSPPK